MRLRDGLRVVRRTATEVQVGTDPRWAVRIDGLPATDAERLSDLLADPAVVDLLTRARLTQQEPVAPLQTAPASVDARVWSLLRRDADGADIVRARGRRIVAVLGLGPTGLGIAAGLATAGVGTVLLDDDEVVRAVDVGPAGFRWTDVGSARTAVAARVLRDLAPHVSTDSVRPPEIVVIVETDVADPVRASALVSAGTVHLSVVVREADTVVGPLVVPGAGPCLRCLDLHRADSDPAWPALLGQLQTSAPADEHAVVSCVAAGLGAAAVLAYLDGVTPSVPGVTFEVAAPDAVPHRRDWAVHPACGCTALPTVP
jgi:hypothetical protein